MELQLTEVSLFRSQRCHRQVYIVSHWDRSCLKDPPFSFSSLYIFVTMLHFFICLFYFQIINYNRVLCKKSLLVYFILFCCFCLFYSLDRLFYVCFMLDFILERRKQLTVTHGNPMASLLPQVARGYCIWSG